MNAETTALGIVLWSLWLAAWLPPEWARKLYRGPIGRIWDGIVLVIERFWEFIKRGGRK